MPIDAWHFADAYTLDRARLNKGFFQSVSVKLPGELNCWTISSKYLGYVNNTPDGRNVVHTRDANRNDIFELIRKEIAPTAPSRNSCFFTFATHADALASQAAWQGFPGLRLEQVHIQDDANVFLGDTEFYTNAGTTQFTVRDAAYRYWLGRRSAAPKMEYLVDGTVFFPNWGTFPAV